MIDFFLKQQFIAPIILFLLRLCSVKSNGAFNFDSSQKYSEEIIYVGEMTGFNDQHYKSIFFHPPCI